MRIREGLAYVGKLGLRPENSAAKTAIPAKTKNARSKIRPTSMDIPAIPYAPKIMETRASTKNANANLSIYSSDGFAEASSPSAHTKTIGNAHATDRDATIHLCHHGPWQYDTAAQHHNEPLGAK